MTGPRPRPSGRAVAAVLVAAILVVLAGLVARADPYVGERPTQAVTRSETPEAAVPTPSTAEERARDEENKALADIGTLQVLTTLFLAVVVFVLALGAWYLFWWLRDGSRWHWPAATAPGRPVAPRAVTRELSAAVEQALIVVEDGPAREAVVACWLLLQRAAAAAGSPARASETARDYAARLAGEQLISEAALTDLAELYREARFSAHEVGPDLRARARRRLAVLQTELGSGVRL